MLDLETDLEATIVRSQISLNTEHLMKDTKEAFVLLSTKQKYSDKLFTVIHNRDKMSFKGDEWFSSNVSIGSCEHFMGNISIELALQHVDNF